MILILQTPKGQNKFDGETIRDVIAQAEPVWRQYREQNIPTMLAGINMGVDTILEIGAYFRQIVIDEDLMTATEFELKLGDKR